MSQSQHTQIKRPSFPSPDAKEEDEAQYNNGPLSSAELDEKYPNRPHNHSLTFLFSELYQSLFNPLNENKKQPAATAGRPIPRTKLGPHGQSKASPHEHVDISLSASSRDGGTRWEMISTLRYG